MGNTWLGTAVLCVTFALPAAGCHGTGCKKEPRDGNGEDPAQQDDAGETTAARLARAAAACAGAEAHGPLRWFVDDYDAALACARAAGRPLVIDAWASWCHTCLSMESTVLVDPGLAPMADRFVWLRADTDNEENAALLSKFPVETWPTIFVVAPEDESLQARHLGAATVNQLRELLVHAETAYQDGTSGALDPKSPLALLREGDRAVVDNHLGHAARAYSAALAAAPADWPRRPELLVSLINALYRHGDLVQCMSLGLEEMDSTGRTASAANFAYYASECARYADDERRAQKTHRLAEKRLEALLADQDAPLSVDDRSDAMRILRWVRDALGDDKGARAIAERQRALLDKAVAKAPSPFFAETYQWSRVEVSLYLGRGMELLPELEKTMAERPDDYNPPYRLAWLHFFYGEYEQALEMGEAALALAYGLRKPNIQLMIANIHRGLGNVDGERAALKAALAMYTALPDGQRNPAMVRGTLDRLMEFEKMVEAGTLAADPPFAKQDPAVRADLIRQFIP